MDTLRSIEYLRYAAPVAKDLNSFLLAHRISRLGQECLLQATEVLHGVSKYEAIATGGMYMTLAAVIIAVPPSEDSGILSSRMVRLSFLALLGAYTLWHVNKRKQVAAQHGVDGTKCYDRGDRLDTQGAINQRIRELTAASSNANFSPVQFENERIYYEQVLTPHVKEHHGIDLPKFEKLTATGLSGLPQPIQDYIRDITSIRKAIEESAFGYVTLDSRLLARLRAGTDLPAPRPSLKFELPAVSGQPDTLAAHQTIYDYRKGLQDRYWSLLGAAGFAVALGAALAPTRIRGESLRSRWWIVLFGTGTTACLALALSRHLKVSHLATEAPWVTTANPEWLQSIGLEHAWAYLHEQAILKAAHTAPEM